MTDPRIDAYIAEAADWAKPILNHLRSLPAKAVPDATETIKWGSPFWEYKGLLCGFSVFKDHCGFVLFNDRDIPEIEALFGGIEKPAFGALGHITSLDDLPPDDILIQAIQLVAAHNEAKKAKPKGAQSAKRPTEALAIPDDLIGAVNQNRGRPCAVGCVHCRQTQRVRLLDHRSENRGHPRQANQPGC